MSLNSSAEDDLPLLISSKTDKRESRNKKGSLWTRDLCPVIKCRVVIAVMAFLGFCNVYALRVNLSMAIVVMVKDTGEESAAVVPVNNTGKSTRVSLAITVVLYYA